MKESSNDPIEAITGTVTIKESQVTNMFESHREELSTSRLNLVLCNDDDSIEEETQEVFINDEESQDGVQESTPFEIQVVMPALIKEEHVYDYSMWPSPPPPSLAPFIQAYQAYEPEQSLVEQMSKKPPNPAKLQGVKNQDPYVVLYDKYYR